MTYMDNLHDFDLTSDPLASFESWYSEAKSNSKLNADVMFLATATKAAMPSVRPVLYKGLSNNKIMFVGNYLSQKGRELEENPQASISFWWEEISKQVRLTGSIEKLDRASADKYFHSRDRGSQIAGYTSEQSEEIADRDALIAKFEAAEKKFEGKEIPPSENWGGWLLNPTSIEFFIYRKNRMNDRLLFKRDKSEWTFKRIQP